MVFLLFLVCECRKPIKTNGFSVFLGMRMQETNKNKWFYFVLAAAAIQLSWQATTVDIHNPADCLTKFRSNTWFGWIVFAAGILG